MKLTPRGQHLIANTLGALGLLLFGLSCLRLYANAGRPISPTQLDHPRHWVAMALCILGALTGVGMVCVAWTILRALHRSSRRVAVSQRPILHPSGFNAFPVAVRYDIPPSSDRPPGSLTCEMWLADHPRALPEPRATEPLRIECTLDPTRRNQ